MPDKYGNHFYRGISMAGTFHSGNVAVYHQQYHREDSNERGIAL